MGGKSDGFVNTMFTLTDSFVVHTIRRPDMFGTIREEWKFIGGSWTTCDSRVSLKDSGRKS